jgi:hypothetical protein
MVSATSVSTPVRRAPPPPTLSSILEWASDSDDMKALRRSAHGSLPAALRTDATSDNDDGADLVRSSGDGVLMGLIDVLTVLFFMHKC